MVAGVIAVYGADSGECGDNSEETGDSWGESRRCDRSAKFWLLILAVNSRRENAGFRRRGSDERMRVLGFIVKAETARMALGGGFLKPIALVCSINRPHSDFSHYSRCSDRCKI